jgi:hypothetical protein
MFGNLFYIKQKIRSTQFYGIYQLIWGLTLAVIFLTDVKKNKGAVKKKRHTGRIQQTWADPLGRRPTSPRHARERSLTRLTSGARLSAAPGAERVWGDAGRQFK